MKYATLTKETTQAKTHSASACSKGIAIAPPAYGINVVDNQPVQAMSAHPQEHQSLDSSTWLAREDLIQRQRENKTGLPGNLKTGLENLSGLSMDEVRVHYNSSKPAQLQALAYTQGTDIYVGPGQERHLPHEGWHVVQQMEGRVRPRMQMAGEQVNDDVGLEREADVMREKLTTRQPITMYPIGAIASDDVKVHYNSSKPVQLQALAYSLPLQLRGRRQRFEGNPLFIKVNFSGSGYLQWNTHADWSATRPSAGWYRQDNPNNKSEPEYYLREKGSNRLTLDFSGPSPRSLRDKLMEEPPDLSGPQGALDVGKNSITNLISTVPDIVSKVIEEYTQNGSDIAPSTDQLVILIKGHSRGAVAASQVANELQDRYPRAQIEVVLYDPVPGPHIQLPLDKGLEDVKATTLVYSLASGHKLFFTPLQLHNAKRLIISKGDHSTGINSEFIYRDQRFSGSGLNRLPQGVYVHHHDDPNGGLILQRARSYDNYLALKNIGIINLLTSSGKRTHEDLDPVVRHFFAVKNQECSKLDYTSSRYK